MPEDIREGIPSQEEFTGGNREVTANHPLANIDVFERLRRVPTGEEPAFWPVRVMTELEYVTDPGEFPDSPRARQWASVRESFLRVKKAYEIAAYPHVKYEGWRECIEAELETDRQAFGRDEVALDNVEIRILGKLAATAEIPFDPQKRRYAYSEVPISPHIDPYGRRNMPTEEIRRARERQGTALNKPVSRIEPPKLEK